jgi:hypothetical protein
MNVSKEMPQYQCHKKVWALKIKAIEINPGFGAIITPQEDGYTSFEVDENYVTKHRPQIGGYYVVYNDDYRSWSPAEAFENGYKRIFKQQKRLMSFHEWNETVADVTLKAGDRYEELPIISKQIIDDSVERYVAYRLRSI